MSNETEANATDEQIDWKEADWSSLILRIKSKRCTPFLGAGACAGILPSGRKLARQWAAELEYPFLDIENLPRVAQYLAVQVQDDFPKLKVVDEFQRMGRPDFTNPNEVHRVIASLNLPLYITTNYDDFMARAIEATGRQPVREYCRWHHVNRRGAEVEVDVTPTVANPVVFHLHGILEDPDSLVLTEDDYLDFLLCIGNDKPKLIPHRIERAFSDSSLLFLGYSLEDMNFKVLFRKLVSYFHINQNVRHLSVQLEPKGEVPDEKEIQRAKRQKKYLRTHFRQKSIKVFWGSCEEFATQLRERWEAAAHV